MEVTRLEAWYFFFCRCCRFLALPSLRYTVCMCNVNERRKGSGLNFMSACIVVQEIAKVDPAVAVLVDIQNTLINNLLR